MAPPAPPPPPPPPLAAPRAPLRLALRGTPTCTGADGRQHVLERKDAALLAKLALDGPTARAELAALLWPAATPAQARSHLRQRLSRLRRRIGAGLVDGADPVGLEAGCRHDLEPTAPEAAAAATSPPGLLSAYDYDDCATLRAWIARRAEAMAARQRQVAADLAATAEERGDAGTARWLREAALAADPLDEPALLALMRLHHRCGDRAAALAAYRRHAAALHEMIGAQPGAATRRLLAEIAGTEAEPGEGPGDDGIGGARARTAGQAGQVRTAKQAKQAKQAIEAREATVPQRTDASLDTTAGALGTDAVVSLALMRPPQLVGRAVDLAALQEVLRGERVAVLMGEPGVGKSRVLAALAAMEQADPSTFTAFNDSTQRAPGFPLEAAPRAHGDRQSLQVQCRPGDDAVPYALVLRLARAVSPALAGADQWPPELARLAAVADGRESAAAPVHPLRLRDTLWRLLDAAASSRRLTVLVDDLQFADLASLELLPLLLDEGRQRNTGTPPRWVLALRTAEVPATVQGWLQRAVPHDAGVVHLPPLDAAQVRQLLASLAACLPPGAAMDGSDAALADSSRRLHRHTGGNPLFLLQTLLEMQRHGGLESAAVLQQAGARLPASGKVRDLLARRLAQLGAPAAELLHVAALAGQDFGVELAAFVLERHTVDLADAWHELESASVMDGARFAHDLIAEAARHAVPAAQAPHWHARIAEHLVGHGGAPARIAGHWRAAGRFAEAGDTFATAAAAIRKLLRQYEEAELLEAAADCHARAGRPEAVAEDLFNLFLAQWSRKQRQGMRDAEQRLQALRETPRGALLADIARGTLGFDERADEASLALLIGAQEAAPRLAGENMLLWLLGWEASCWSLLNEPERALRAAERGAAIGEVRTFDYFATGGLLMIAGTHEVCAQVRKARDLLRKVVQVSRAAGDYAYENDSTCHLSLSEYHLGHVDVASELLQAGRRGLAELNGGRAEPHTTDFYQSRYWRDQGRYAEAMALMAENHRRTEQGGEVNLHAICGHELALSYVALGQPERARAYLDKPRQVPKKQAHLESLVLEAELERLAGRAGTPALQAALALVPRCPRPERHRWRIELELAREMDPAAAVALLERSLHAAEALEIWSAAGPLRVVCIQARLRAGDTAAAAREAHVLRERLRTLAPMTLYPLEYALTLWRAFDAAGEAEAAGEVAAQALAWMDRVAREHVPAEFRQSFLERNPVNRQLRALAQRQPA
ncbi:MAG: AAA family ATPase [Burkholderiales bacterium]|nr:AAA family ATPase [Burkholderiales bacterium]